MGGLVGWKESKAVPPKDFECGAQDVCKLSAEQLATTPPYDASYKSSGWNKMKGLCFNSWLAAEFLKASGFAPDDTSVNYTKKYGGESLTWTRGAVLYQSLYTQRKVRNDDLDL